MSTTDSTWRRTLQKISGNMLANHHTSLELLKKTDQNDRIALIYHVEIVSSEDYGKWLDASDAALKKYTGKRIYSIEVDPVPREELDICEITVYEFATVKGAEAFFTDTVASLARCLKNLTVLAICPEPKVRMLFVRLLSKLLRTFNRIKDPEIPPSTWKPSNSRVWPDEQQMRVAPQQELSAPILVYNLNKNRVMAQYKDKRANTDSCSGEEAYERYSKAVGPLLLRRGAYPVYGGRPLGVLYRAKNSLWDDWDKFILVYYPQRRNLLAMIESEEYQVSQFHRDAGLERVTVFIGKNKL